MFSEGDLNGDDTCDEREGKGAFFLNMSASTKSSLDHAGGRGIPHHPGKRYDYRASQKCNKSST